MHPPATSWTFTLNATFVKYLRVVAFSWKCNAYSEILLQSRDQATILRIARPAKQLRIFETPFSTIRHVVFFLYRDQVKRLGSQNLNTRFQSSRVFPQRCLGLKEKVYFFAIKCTPATAVHCHRRMRLSMLNPNIHTYSNMLMSYLIIGN